MKIMHCEFCDKSLGWRDYHCPHCTHRNHGLLRIYFVVGLVMVVILFIAGLAWLMKGR